MTPTLAPRADIPRAVLLDALGTLVGLEPPWPALVHELRARHGIVVGLDRATAALRSEMAYYRANCQEARDAATLADLRRRCARVLSDELGKPVAGLDLDTLTATLLGALRFRAYPDAAPALRELRVANVAAVVVSNWDISLHDVLANTGLSALLDGVVTSAEQGVSKPARAIFTAALELVGVDAGDALHVGDSLEEDVRGARDAGIASLLLVREPGPLLAGGGSRPDSTQLNGVRTIATLAELPLGGA